MGYANAHTFQRSIHLMLACSWRLFQEPPWLEHDTYWCLAPFLLLLVSGTHNLRLYWCWKKRSIFFGCLHNFPFKVANDGTLVLFLTTVLFVVANVRGLIDGFKDFYVFGGYFLLCVVDICPHLQNWSFCPMRCQPSLMQCSHKGLTQLSQNHPSVMAILKFQYNGQCMKN